MDPYIIHQHCIWIVVLEVGQKLCAPVSMFDEGEAEEVDKEYSAVSFWFFFWACMSEVVLKGGWCWCLCFLSKGELSPVSVV